MIRSIKVEVTVGVHISVGAQMSQGNILSVSKEQSLIPPSV
jgi:hypothetical protein